jgi:hypothetical protein
MAENKKSFLLYCDLIHTISKMPDDKAGELFKHILAYVNDQNPETEDLIIQLTFEPIKQQLKRDLLKYKEISGIRSEIGKLAGIKSGEARRTKAKQNEPIGLKSNQNEQDNVTVTVKDNDKEKDIKYYRSFLHLKLTFEEFEKLKALGYSQKQIDSILDSVENYKKNKDYTSLYLTAKKWLEREKKTIDVNAPIKRNYPVY